MACRYSPGKLKMSHEGPPITHTHEEEESISELRTDPF